MLITECLLGFEKATCTLMADAHPSSAHRNSKILSAAAACSCKQQNSRLQTLTCSWGPARHRQVIWAFNLIPIYNNICMVHWLE